MLEQLFGSKTRVKLMKIFLENPEKQFFIRELTRMTDSMINSIRRELNNLVALGLIVIEDERRLDGVDAIESKINAKKFYKLNPNDLFHQALANLFSKGEIFLERQLIDKLKGIGEIKYLCLGGFFVDDPKSATDILIVGDFGREKVIALLRNFEKDIKKEVRYTLMNEEEFMLRRDITDGFLMNIIGNEGNIVVMDSLTSKFVKGK